MFRPMFANSQNCNVKVIFVEIWHTFSMSLKGVSFSPQYPFCSFQKDCRNSFIFVIIINNECVSKYAYEAMTIFAWDTENIYISFTIM